jgi:hypothetical protein
MKMTEIGEPLNTDAMIHPFEFAEIITDKLEKDGLHQYDLVFVANMQAFPIDKNDPYLQRLHAFVHPWTGDEDLIDLTKIIVIDPVNLKRLTNEENLAWVDQLKRRYDKEAPTQDKLVLDMAEGEFEKEE